MDLGSNEQKNLNSEELWGAVLAEMENSLSKANFTTWFKGTAMLSSGEGAVVVSVPNGFIKEWLENKFNKQIFHILRRYQPEIRDIRYVIGNPKTTLPPTKKSFIQLFPENRIKEAQEGDIDKANNLNRRYSFETYVVGPNNELAHAAGFAVSQNPGKLYNPLFIYGGVGLGKTHLLQAMGNQVAAGDRKVLYIPAERLITNVIDSIKNHTTESLKQKYFALDMLIIDDIQFLSGKTTTQEIFFAIFNDLYSRGKQIVLSSDRQPSTIPALEERLKSRFEGGMMADIGIPEYETRLAILKQKSKEKNFSLEEECLNYIATNIQKNIRELEGALNRIIAYGQIYNKVPTIKEVKQLLGAYLNTPYKKPNSQLVIKSVADFYKIPINDLIKRSRRKEVVRPRQVAMYLLREEVKYSFPEIGIKLGGRDHSTVIHACAKIKDEETNNENTRQELNMIKERIYQIFENT